VIDAFVRVGNRLRALNIGDGPRKVGEITIGEGIDSPYPFPLLLAQSRTEAILSARLAELGVEVERGVELVGLEEDGDGVTASLKRADGATEATRALYLAGCDGARSAVRHALGIDFEGITEPETFLLGDVRIDGGDLDDRSLYLWWHDGGTIALFPFEEGVWRVFAVRDAAGDEPATLEELQRAVDRHGPPGLRLRDPTWLSVFRINERLAAHYRKGRCFLAGDAAHIHSPAGGQGMNTGIQDAVNLGWKLAYALKGLGDAATLLDSYEAERRPTARAVVDESAQRQHMAFANSRIAQALKGIAVSIISRLPSLQRMLQVQLSETAIVYRDGPLVALGAPPRKPARTDVGSRALDAAWHDPATGAERPLWPLLSPLRHTLLVFEDAPGTVDAARVLDGMADEVGVLRLDATADPGGRVRERYRMRRPGWVLIRPDQVIAARGEAGDVAVLQTYLERVVRPRAAH
jgi:2-polyprenyl-6-methoxyphenol hydroxylase-like FAD-dependent oxidoreductase